MTSLLTADWYPYGKNGFFRKVEVTEMGWFNELSIDNVVVVPARFGGPIAVIRDRTKLGRPVMKGLGKPVIAIYTATGCLISSFIWNSGQLVHIGWSGKEDLLCIQENGDVLIYSIHGKYIHAFRMGQEVEDTKVIDAQIFYNAVGTGVCVLTGAYRLFLTNNIHEPKVRKLAEIPGNAELPNSWIVMCEDRQTHVLLSKSTDIFDIYESHILQKNINFGGDGRECCVTDMAISPCDEHVALFSSQEQLWIGSANLRKNYRLYDMSGFGRPKQLTWCGSEAVVGYWSDNVIIIGSHEDTVNYAYDYEVKLVTEIDCVRVISTFYSDIIQPVPKDLAEIYRLNSTSPGSYLLEASKQFQKKNYRAHEYIHLVKPHLTSAIEQCIEASGHEFITGNQKMLMKAAQFGKTFAYNFNSEGFVRMCRILRVINAVRSFKIGIMLTYPQFEHLSIQNLLDRLVMRRLYYLAIKAAKYMRLGDDTGSLKILEHWAFYKVSQLDADREQVANDIAAKLGKVSGISFINIARSAASQGRIQLAVKLIDFEPRPVLQVTMLLELEKFVKALEKSVQSGSTDLMNIVLVKMQRKMPFEEFQMEIRREPAVYALYKKQCKEQNEKALINIYRQEDDNNEIAACHVKNAYHPENFSTRTAMLENAKDHYRKARNETNTLLCEEQKRLITKQKELEDKYKREFLDLSLQDTIYRLLLMKEIKMTDDLRVAYRFSERKYWYLRIRSMAENEDWSEMDQFSKNKKSPIGLEPFVDICLLFKNQVEAKRYVNRVKEENKIKYFIKMKMYAEAIKLAESLKDVNALQYIKADCAQADCDSLVDEINSALVRLNVVL